MKIFLIVSKRINKLLINGANISYQHKLKHCQNLTKLLRQFPFDLGIPLFRTGITIVLAKVKSSNYTHIQTCYRQTGYIAVAKKVEVRRGGTPILPAVRRLRQGN